MTRARVKLSYTLTALLALGVLFAAPAGAMRFKVSQIGYHPDAPKYALLEDIPEGREVEVIIFDPDWVAKWELYTGKTLYDVTRLSRVENHDMARPGTYTLRLDFSDFTGSGDYELRVEGTDVKQPIRVSEYIYWDPLKPVVKTFYFQRNAQPIEDKSLDFFHYDCYMDAGLPAKDDGRRVDAGGGWYADDTYRKSATDTALAVARLISLYEHNQKSLNYFRLGYPFSEPELGSIPDLLIEMKVGLNWLLAMQRPDGGIHSFVAGKNEDCAVLADSSDSPDRPDRYIGDVSLRDTAATAAVLAMTSRAFQKQDLGYAVKALREAEHIWTFLEKHPPALADDPILPYRLWAAAELYTATGNEKYHQVLLDYAVKVPVTVYSRENPAIQGYLDYVLHAPDKHPQLARGIREGVVSLADTLTAVVQRYPLTAGLRQFGRNTSYRVTGQIALLGAAYELTGKEAYRDAATLAMDYLFGMNRLGRTFVTGLGSLGVEHPVHRRFAGKSVLIPGMLVYGPNSKADDGKTTPGLKDLSYLDHSGAWASNGFTILNNANLAYALGLLNAAYNKDQD